MKKYASLSLLIILIGCSSDDNPTENQTPLAPLATEASDVTNESFTANWNNSAGNNDYELEVATDVNFNTIVDNQDHLGGSTLVDNLNGNTEYYYRVRAVSITGGSKSENSSVIAAYTLPDAPVAVEATNVTSSGFSANWGVVPGINEYLLYVSEDNIPVDPPNFLPDYNGIEVTGTSHNVSDLNSGTFYYYVVKAKAGDRISEISNSILVSTGN